MMIMMLTLKMRLRGEDCCLFEVLDVALIVITIDGTQWFRRLSLRISDMDTREEETESLHERSEEGWENDGVDLADGMEDDVESTQVGSPTPDGFEWDASEHAAPVQAQADTAQVGQDLVAEVAAAVEAFVGVAPHAVGRVSTLRFG